MSEAPKKDSYHRANSVGPVLSVFSPEHDDDPESPQSGWLSADMTLVEFYDAYVMAYHAIAHVLDWSDRERIWADAGLPPIEAGRCKYERDLLGLGT